MPCIWVTITGAKLPSLASCLFPGATQLVIWAHIPLPSNSQQAKASEKGPLAKPVPPHFLEVIKACQVSPSTNSHLHFFPVFSWSCYRADMVGGQERAGPMVIISVHTLQLGHHLQSCTHTIKLRFFFICSFPISHLFTQKESRNIFCPFALWNPSIVSPLKTKMFSIPFTWHMALIRRTAFNGEIGRDRIERWSSPWVLCHFPFQLCTTAIL